MYICSANSSTNTKIQDTNDFLRKLNKIEKIPDNSSVVSIDVRSLYTSIPNSEGTKKFLENFSKRTVATKLITSFLSIILMLNNFVSNCQNWLQIKGCTMGTICVEAYANSFMDHFERKYIYPFLEGFSLSYLRSIDGTFSI